MTTTRDAEELGWQNTIFIMVVQACWGHISQPVRGIWIEFEENRHVTIHVRLSEQNEDLLEDVEKIVIETIAYLGLEYADRVDREIHLDNAKPKVDQTRYRWIYLPKAE